MNDTKNRYVYFSNTLGEFEAFVKSGLMFWPRGYHLIYGKTKYQTENKLAAEEQEGDIVYVVVGSRIRGFEYTVDGRTFRIEKTPNLVFVGTVDRVINHPIICYKFKPENVREGGVVLPVESFEYLFQSDTFLGVKLTKKDKEEINNVININIVIENLPEGKELKFEELESNGSRKKKWMLTPESKILIKEYLIELDKQTNWDWYVEKLDTWSQKQYVIVKLNLQNPILAVLESIDTLDQGVFTRQLTDVELNSYKHLGDDYSKVYIAILEKINELNGEKQREAEKRSNMDNPNININENIKEVAKILKFNKQVVLTGAPGTGKTYLAKEVCKTLLAETKGKKVYELTEDDIKKFIKIVQFHPSYDYTDFVEGLRPVKKGNDIVFERKDGIFMELCLEAIRDENKNDNFFLIIDEINRSDLSKVFGELMYCLEYRGKDGRIKTQYSNLLEDDHPFKDGFYVPENVYIIATMNDIDRSVEAFDFALRRRFFWYEIKANDVMESTLRSMFTITEINNKDELISDLIKSAISLNNIISTEGKYYGLDDHYHLGPAYFGKIPLNIIKSSNGDVKEIKRMIWKYKIEQILREYVRGYDNIDDFIHKAKEAFENPT